MQPDKDVRIGVGAALIGAEARFIPAGKNYRKTDLKQRTLCGFVWTAVAAAAAPGVVLHAAPLCTSVVESGWASGSTERDATDRAILWWSSRAGAIGPGYESWERAQRKNIRCEPISGQNAFRCKVLAAPCLPDGMIPPPKKGDQLIEL